MIIVFVWSGQIAIAHDIDFDEDHHTQHDCQVYQSYHDILFQENVAIFLVCISRDTSHLALSNVPIQPLYFVQARAPPSSSNSN